MEECAENIEETRLIEITSANNKNKHKCSSCTLYIVLFSKMLQYKKIDISEGIDVNKTSR